MKLTITISQFLLFLLCAELYAQNDSVLQQPVQFTPERIIWKEGPANLPKGVEMCLLYSNPKATGPFAARFKFPANYKLYAHYHENDEVVTVLEGSVFVGFGDKTDMSVAKEFKAGSFYVNPARSHHFVVIGKKGAVVQINSVGPWTLEFIEKP